MTQPDLFSAPVAVKRAPYQGRTVRTREASRSGSDAVTATHRGKALRLLSIIEQRGPMTLNEMADALTVPISSACSLRDCIAVELEESEPPEVVLWSTGKTTTRTRWRARSAAGQ